MKKKTTNEFIYEANIKHNNKYDYSLVEYKNSKIKVKIICPIHGIFEQRPNDHLNTNGCSECGGVKKHTTESFIKKVSKIHNNKYDYSLVEYNGNNKSMVKIICPIHGIFEQRIISHINGYGCYKCGMVSSIINRTTQTNDFIDKVRKIHNNKYDYSLIDYKNSSTKIKIICPIHGIFKQRPCSHLYGNGCPKCGGTLKMTTIDFINKVNIIHNNRYNYEKTIYINNSIKVKINCEEHGEFEQTPNDHISGSGCPKCNQSKGELKIKRLLEKYKINFYEQKTFIDCKDKGLLKFDFYLPYHNICIEYDGEQHFKPIKKWGGEENLKKIKYRDNIKNKYCIDKNITLIRINYNEDIELKINNIINNI